MLLLQPCTTALVRSAKSGLLLDYYRLVNAILTVRVLVLATKDLLRLEQHNPYGPVSISIIA